MKTSLFDFDLPDSCIAQEPALPRDSARMLVVGEQLQDKIVSDFPSLLNPNDLLVFNNTRVIPARLYGVRGEAQIEITLHKMQKDGDWLAFARPGKKLREGDQITMAASFFATVVEKREMGEIRLRFNLTSADFFAALSQYGEMPLPPYIRREKGEKSEDLVNYQTIFAQKEGAVAAPTAGLHFTDTLFDALRQKQIPYTYVTLHVGAGTFLPVKVEDTNDHIMHSEYAELTQETVDAVHAARAAGGRVIAVGTTSLRVLESAAVPTKELLRPIRAETNLFITPGFPFKVVDMLFTNFHLPRSTLFMLVSAFAGLERMKAAYQHAIDQNYRFYSYGDASLLYREKRA